MTSHLIPSLGILIGVLALPLGCGSDDSGSDASSGGGTAITGTGGLGSASTGSGGSSSGGSGAATGGDAAAYWPAAYDPAGAPVDDVDADGVYYHASSQAGPCMLCHTPGTAVSTPPYMAFGGTVYKSDGVTPAAHVQVGVKDGTSAYFVYSNAYGHYWAEGPNSVSWAPADIRMRNSSGEVPKTADMERGADCDSCHFGSELLTIAP